MANHSPYAAALFRIVEICCDRSFCAIGYDFDESIEREPLRTAKQGLAR